MIYPPAETTTFEPRDDLITVVCDLLTRRKVPSAGGTLASGPRTHVIVTSQEKLRRCGKNDVRAVVMARSRWESRGRSLVVGNLTYQTLRDTRPLAIGNDACVGNGVCPVPWRPTNSATLRDSVRRRMLPFDTTGTLRTPSLSKTLAAAGIVQHRSTASNSMPLRERNFRP